MTMRSWVVLSVVAVLELLALPVLAHPAWLGPRAHRGAQQPAGQPIFDHAG